MKKILIVVSFISLVIGALLCAFILKDWQVSVPEAAVGLVWLLSINALAIATARAAKKPAGENSTSPSLTLGRGSVATDPEFHKPAA